MFLFCIAYIYVIWMSTGVRRRFSIIHHTADWCRQKCPIISSFNSKVSQRWSLRTCNSMSTVPETPYHPHKHTPCTPYMAFEPSICWCCEISTFCREDLVRTNSCTWRSCHSLICVVVSELRVQVDADLGFSILILSWCCLRLASVT